MITFKYKIVSFLAKPPPAHTNNINQAKKQA